MSSLVQSKGSGRPKLNQERHAWLEKVVELGKAVARVTDLQACLCKIHESVRHGLGFDRVGIFLYDAQDNLFRGSLGTDRQGNVVEEWDMIISPARRESFHLLRDSRDGLIYVPDFWSAYTDEGHTMDGVGEHVLVAAWAGDEPVAVISADNLLTGRPMHETQLEALRLFAGYAGLAIRNARLLQQVQEAEGRYRDIFEHALEGIFQSTPDGRFLRANPAMARILGYPTAQALIDDTQDIAHQFFVDPEQRQAVVRQLQEKGMVLDCELQVRRRDGSLAWVSENTRLFDSDGKTYLEGVLQDITERRRAQEALDQERALFFQGPVVVLRWGLGADWPIEYVSSNIAQFGYDAQDLLSGRIAYRELIHPDDLQGIIARNMRRPTYQQSGEFVSLGHEYRIVCADGRVRWVYDYTRLVCDKEGKPICYHGYILDITARRQAEAAVLESQERLRALVQNSSDVIVLLDQNGRVLYASDSMQQVLGWSPESMVGEGAFRFVHPEDQEAAQECVDEAVARAGLPVSREFRLRHKNGCWVDVEAVASSHLENPGVNGLVVNVRDVTERKQWEERSLQGQKMEALGRLAGGVAHDFNNLLTAIQGYTSFLLDSLAEETALSFDTREGWSADLRQVERAAQRAAALTGQLLAFSRKQVLQPHVLDLNALVHGTEQMLRRLIGENIELITHLDPALGWVRADPGKMEQAIVNLAINARDAMPEGGQLVLETKNVILEPESLEEEPASRYSHRVHTLAPAQPLRYGSRSYVCLVVGDTGLGMSKEVIAHLFEPFFTTKEIGAGTGLGLAMVHGFVKQSGGEVQVHSEPGLGSVFQIYLPQVEEGAPGPAEQHNLILPRGTEMVLLVEDEPIVRDLAQRTLQNLGYTVLAAGDAMEALHLDELHAGHIDLLLTDVVMPVLSGRALAERLWQRHVSKIGDPFLARGLSQGAAGAIRVLYMSGYTDEVIAQQDIVQPGTGFLQKPFTPSALARKVREVLDG